MRLPSTGEFARYPQIAQRIRERLKSDTEFVFAARWAAIVELIVSDEISGHTLEWVMRVLAALEVRTKHRISAPLKTWMETIRFDAGRRGADPWYSVVYALIGHERDDNSAFWKEITENPDRYRWTLDRLTHAVMSGSPASTSLTLNPSDLDARARRLFGSNIFWSGWLRKQVSSPAKKGDAVELIVMADPFLKPPSPETDWALANARISSNLDRAHEASAKLSGARIKFYGFLTPEWDRVRALIAATGGHFEQASPRGFDSLSRATKALAEERKFDCDILVVTSGWRYDDVYNRPLAPKINGVKFLVQCDQRYAPVSDFDGHLAPDLQLNDLLVRLSYFAPAREPGGADTESLPPPAQPGSSSDPQIASGETERDGRARFQPELLPPQANHALRFAPNTTGAMAVLVSVTPERFKKLRVELQRKAASLLLSIEPGCQGFDLVAPMRPKLEGYLGALRDGDYDLIRIWSAGNSLRRAFSADVAKLAIPDGWYESFPPTFAADLADLVETHNVAMATHPDGVSFDSSRASPGKGHAEVNATGQAVAEILTMLPKVMEKSASNALVGVLAAAQRVGELEDTTSRMEVSVGENSIGNAITAIVEQGQTQAAKLSLAERQILANEAQASALQEANALARAGMRPSTWLTVARTALVTTAVGGGIAAATGFVLSFSSALLQLADKMPLIGGPLRAAIEALCRYFNVPV